MFKIFKYMRRQDWPLLGICTVFIALQVWLDLKLPDYMSEITMLVQTPGSKITDIAGAGSFMLLCALGSLASALIVGFFAARLAAGFAMTLREKMFNKTMSFSMEEINGFSTSSLIIRSTNDINQVQMFVAMGMQAIVKAPILAVWAMCKISGKSWQWSLSTGVAVFVMLILLAIIIVFAMPKFKKIQTLTDNLNLVTRENLLGLKVVRAYNAEEYQAHKFEAANTKLTDTNLYATRIMAVLQPGMQLIMSGLSLAIYWVGAYLISNAGQMAQMTLFSDMVVFSSYAVQVIMAFMLLSIIFIMVPRVSVSAKRINEVLDTQTKIIDGKLTSVKGNLKGEIELRNVGFKYPDAAEYVLQNISFTAHQGEMVAFIGSTGSGKSTLINLIPRFYDVTEGEILVDGINVKEYTQNALHKKMGYVSQRAVMFSGSLGFNVAYGTEEQSESEAVKQAVAIAQSTDFVENMPKGYKSTIAQGGSNLSGGQKQRLAIARAICHRPEIYIFDDSFSALDYKTDRLLRQALKEELQDATMLVVAQRIGTIKDADKIIVLDEGKIVGMGKHKDLLKSCTTYQEIAYSQLSKEELENE